MRERSGEPSQPHTDLLRRIDADEVADSKPTWRDRVDLRRGFVWLLATAAIIAVIIGLAILDQFYRSTSSAIPTYNWDFNTVQAYLPALIGGFGLTILIAVFGIFLGLGLGIVVAFGRLSSIGPVRLITTGYIELMRGTPMLVQLVWVYYALPIVTGLQLPALESVILAITLNAAAFYGEAFRSGIQAIPREQLETADILGLSYLQRMQYVVVPQAVRIVLPVLISLSISLFKDTSLVSTIGVGDLMYAGRIVADQTYRPLEIFTTVAIIYFVVAFPTTIVMRRIEIHLNRHLKLS